MRVTPNCDSIRSFYISQATGVQWSQNIVFGAGNYFVVWSDGRDSGYYYIYGSRVTPSGTVLDPSGIQIGTNTGAVSQYYPAVAFNGSRYFTIWQYSATPYGITGRFVSTTGVPAETSRVCTPGAYAYALSLAFDGTNFMVAWVEYSGTGYNVKSQMVSSAGAPIGGIFTIATGISYPSLGLCFDGTNYLLTWTQTQIWGRKYNRSGQPVGSAFRISNSSNTQYFGAVAAGSNNRYLNAWSEYVGTYYDIYGNVDVLMTDVEEIGAQTRSTMRLRSSVVRDAIQLVGSEGKKAVIFDATGREIGQTLTGYFDARRLECGVYFVKVASTKGFKVIKVH